MWSVFNIWKNHPATYSINEDRWSSCRSSLTGSSHEYGIVVLLQFLLTSLGAQPEFFSRNFCRSLGDENCSLLLREANISPWITGKGTNLSTQNMHLGVIWEGILMWTLKKVWCHFFWWHPKLLLGIIYVALIGVSQSFQVDVFPPESLGISDPKTIQNRGIYHTTGGLAVEYSRLKIAEPGSRSQEKCRKCVCQRAVWVKIDPAKRCIYHISNICLSWFWYMIIWWCIYNTYICVVVCVCVVNLWVDGMLWLVEGRKLGSKTFNREIAILKTIKSLAANFKKLDEILES